MWKGNHGWCGRVGGWNERESFRFDSHRRRPSTSMLETTLPYPSLAPLSSDALQAHPLKLYCTLTLTGGAVPRRRQPRFPAWRKTGNRFGPRFCEINEELTVPRVLFATLPITPHPCNYRHFSCSIFRSIFHRIFLSHDFFSFTRLTRWSAPQVFTSIIFCCYIFCFRFLFFQRRFVYNIYIFCIDANRFIDREVAVILE